MDRKRERGFLFSCNNEIVLEKNTDHLRRWLPLGYFGRIVNSGVFWGMLSWIQTMAIFLGSMTMKTVRVLFTGDVNSHHRPWASFHWLLNGFFSCRICILFSCIFRKKTYVTSASRINFDGFNQIFTCYTASVSYVLLRPLVNSLDMHTGGSIYIRSCPLILRCEVRQSHCLN